jgi:hypothetical protein
MDAERTTHERLDRGGLLPRQRLFSSQRTGPVRGEVEPLRLHLGCGVLDGWWLEEWRLLRLFGRDYLLSGVLSVYALRCWRRRMRNPFGKRAFELVAPVGLKKVIFAGEQVAPPDLAAVGARHVQAVVAIAAPADYRCRSAPVHVTIFGASLAGPQPFEGHNYPPVTAD